MDSYYANKLENKLTEIYLRLGNVRDRLIQEGCEEAWDDVYPEFGAMQDIIADILVDCDEARETERSR